jgi:hypothetical protein
MGHQDVGVDAQGVLLTFPQQAIEVEGEIGVRGEGALAVTAALYDARWVVTAK